MFDENIAPEINKKPQQKAAAGLQKPKSGKTIEETYTKKTQLEHILLRPDTYVGSVEKQTQPMWVLEPESKQMVFRPCSFVPGLYKIFDEIIVNAADNKQRDASMNKIDVVINPEQGFVRVWNNGSGIPIVVHQEHKIYVPELIFGNLLTGSNFDDEEEKTTGGRNGYGAKLANIFSTQFIVETADKARGLKYKQTFRNNMSIKSEPEISRHSGEDYTCITFYPDLARFKMTHVDEDIVALFSKRVYDIAGTNTAAGPKLSVFLNGERIEARNFQQYIALYKGLEAPCAFERVNDRWEIGVGVSDGSFQQVSFVNSICTMKGGCHVTYIADQITNKLMGVVKKRNKGQEVKSNQIKNHLAVYVNALVVNPAFDSQTKENLTTKASAFGSQCIVSEKMMKAVEKSGIIDNILNWAKFKQDAELKKKSGSKRSKLVGITKLDDANFAGSSKSKECTLILTEGDSAKALAISGLGVVGRDFYGVFPLKGKLLNVREATHQQMMKNEEIQNIVKILGLSFGRDYTDTSSLRYGHLMIMTDQDHDGSHIKGLLINFLHYFWPSLLKIPGFLQQFITPIVKCVKGTNELTFFTIPEYTAWKEQHCAEGDWKIKYYKGLGTSTAAEAKEYFSHLSTHQIDFEWDEQANDMVDMAFAKKRVDDRKLWLLSLEPGVHIDYNVDRISYNEFVNKELILFSHADNERSIPHFCDGFKPSQRKVLFACFKRNLKQEIKVSQLAGYISEHAAYHHGEASLTQTIVGMAQNFVGSNNINLLSPCGQFGTRLMGGKDAASARYVFTKLEAITRCIFHADDDPLLEYLDDDGQSIEPTFYIPVIPMVLVNGSEGIGTGWSTSVPTYNPREIIANLRLMIAGQPPSEMKPWYRGFIGDIQAKSGRDSSNFTVAGVMEQVDASTVLIKELPVGRWTTDYKQYLESVLIGATPAPKEKDENGNAAAVVPAFIKDFKENHTDTTVLFTVTMAPEKLQEAIDDKLGIYKKFKLESSVATTNMHMFDLNSQIKKFESATDVMNAFYDVRIRFYDKRKDHLVAKLKDELDKLDNKVRFIQSVISGKLIISNRKKTELLNELKSSGYRSFVETDISSDDVTEGDIGRGYNYLLGMKIWSLTQERVVALISQRDHKRLELAELLTKTAEDLWLSDLDRLEDALSIFEADIENARQQELKAQNKARADRAKPVKSKAKARDYDDDDMDDFIDDGSDSDFEDRKKPKAKKAAKGAATAQTTNVSTKLTGALIPRKIIVEKEKPPVDPSVVVKSKSKVADRSKSIVMNLEDVEDEEPVVMTLAERLAAKQNPMGGLVSSVRPVAATTKAIAAATKKPVANTKKPVKKSKKVSDSEEEDEFDEDSTNFSEDDNDNEPAVTIATTRAPRAAAAKVVWAVDDDDEDEFSEQEESDDYSEDENEDDVESEFEEPVQSKAKPKAASTKSVPIKAAAPVKVAAPDLKPKAAAASAKITDFFGANSKQVVSTSVPSSPPQSKTAGIKRNVKKSKKTAESDEEEFEEDAFIANTPSPVVPKKAKKTAASVKVPAMASLVTATSATIPPAKKAPAPKAVKTAPKATKSSAVPKKKSKQLNSDDEDYGAAPQIAKRSPKPTRARKATNFADYFEDSASEDLMDSESDYDD